VLDFCPLLVLEAELKEVK